MVSPFSRRIAPGSFFARHPARLLATGWLCVVSLGAQPKRQLFLDPSFLRETDHAELKVNPPPAREIVLQPEKLWEQQSIGAFVTVREEAGRLRMWYCCKDRGGRLFMAYAESSDGRHWVKPNLGVFDYQGSRDNNIVIEQFWEGTPFRDPHSSSPEENYVYVGHGHEKGIYRFTSSDGLRWKRDPEPLLPFRVDTHDVTFWDERLGCYVLYLRGWNVDGAWDERMRKVVRLTLPTLARPAAIKSSGRGANPKNPKDLPRVVDEIPTVLETDGLDPKNTDVYNMEAQPYPLDNQWYVAFPAFFRRKNLVDGRLEVQFAGSHDGISWYRYDRAPYVSLGLPGSDSANRVYLGTGVIARGDELWQYGVSYWSPHGALETKQTEIEEPATKPKTSSASRSDGTLYRYVQRVDGFVSLDFELMGGRCLTAPVKVDGDRLRLNVDTGALGSIRVGLVNTSGQAIPGFGVDDCDPIETNSTHAPVTWRTRGDISALEGQDVCVRVVGSRTKLYSFYFDRTHGG